MIYFWIALNRSPYTHRKYIFPIAQNLYCRRVRPQTTAVHHVCGSLLSRDTLDPPGNMLMFLHAMPLFVENSTLGNRACPSLEASWGERPKGDAAHHQHKAPHWPAPMQHSANTVTSVARDRCITRPPTRHQLPKSDAALDHEQDSSGRRVMQHVTTNKTTGSLRSGLLQQG